MNDITKWDKLLILNYFSGPIFIMILLIGSIIGELQLVAIITLTFTFLYSLFNLTNVIKKKSLYSQISLVFSSYVMILTVFSPFFIINSDIAVELFAVFYNVIILPLFVLQAYSTIYVITKLIS